MSQGNATYRRRRWRNRCAWKEGLHGLLKSWVGKPRSEALEAASSRSRSPSVRWCDETRHDPYGSRKLMCVHVAEAMHRGMAGFVKASRAAHVPPTTLSTAPKPTIEIREQERSRGPLRDFSESQPELDVQHCYVC